MLKVAILSPRALAADADPVIAIGLLGFKANVPGHEDGWVERLSFDWADNAKLLAVRLLGTWASDSASPASSSSSAVAAASAVIGRFAAGFVSSILALVSSFALVLPATLLLL